MSRSASPFQGSPVRVIAAFSRTLDFNKLDAPAQCFLTTSTVSLYVRSGLTWGLCLLSAFRPLTASFGAVVCVAPRADYTIVLPAPHLSSRVGKRACFFCGVVVVLVVFFCCSIFFVLLGIHTCLYALPIFGRPLPSPHHLKESLNLEEEEIRKNFSRSK